MTKLNPKINKANEAKFSQQLLTWYDKHGRKDLPWKLKTDPYHIWLSEIMLQQTQVRTVIPYFLKFIKTFPTIEHLAQAPQDAVLQLWAGLGYYARARHLHLAAKQICDRFNGHFPQDKNVLETLPGIGPSTAAAIVSLAFDRSATILDGNVKRVLARIYAISGHVDASSTKKTLWEIAQRLTPKTRCADYTQAIMDLGATCCTRQNPRCEQCPVERFCLAKQMKRQTDFPSKKIKRQKPVKARKFLIILNQYNDIYFVKRPQKGIWGGLWCLPELAKTASHSRFLRQQLNCGHHQQTALMPFKHQFTHYELMLYPLILLTHKRTRNQHHDYTWQNIQHAINLGLPTPIVTCLNLLKEYLESTYVS